MSSFIRKLAVVALTATTLITRPAVAKETAEQPELGWGDKAKVSGKLVGLLWEIRSKDGLTAKEIANSLMEINEIYQKAGVTPPPFLEDIEEVQEDGIIVFLYQDGLIAVLILILAFWLALARGWGLRIVGLVLTVLSYPILGLLLRYSDWFSLWYPAGLALLGLGVLALFHHQWWEDLRQAKKLGGFKAARQFWWGNIFPPEPGGTTQKGDGGGTDQPPPVARVTCGRCGGQTPGNRTYCQQCGRPLAQRGENIREGSPTRLTRLGWRGR